nr:MAG TPA: hypothetical protein [Caudoviricetes sp.]
MNQHSWRVSPQLPNLWGKSIFFEKSKKTSSKCLTFSVYRDII